MVIVYDLLSAQVPKPVAVTVKVNEPLADGVPLKTPVAEFSDNPGGSEPGVTV
jgi:hypothetical protein